MSLQRLDIGGLRNLQSVRFKDFGRINIFAGANGSGKTSLLEAIYLLGMGRSFRSGRLAPMINSKMDRFVVYGEVLVGGGGRQSLAVKKSKLSGQEIRVNRASTVGAAELARLLPIQLINSDVFALLGGGPKIRRQFMDWGVFHVKPDFLETWRRAQRCLRQRNHLLRQRGRGAHGRVVASELAIWTRELAECGVHINNERMKYIEEIRPLFFEILGRMIELSGLTLGYYSGWDSASDLMVAMQEGLERDIQQGKTLLGVHRANLDIRINGAPAVEILSRGQQKLVASSLRLAQGKHLTRQSGADCIFLIDDLAAELDKNHRRALCEILDEMGCQTFVTCVDADILNNVWLGDGVRRFHVEQGRILAI